MDPVTIVNPKHEKLKVHVTINLIIPMNDKTTSQANHGALEIPEVKSGTLEE